jgi:nucleoside-diphosphate-sugar epimerase
MNILITGGFGLIGRKLVNELSKNNNFNLFLISKNINQKKIAANIVTIEHDLLLPIPIEKIPKDINVIIHLAAIAHKTSSKINEINCLITKNIIDPFLNKNVKFIFFSSVAVYGEANRKFPIKTSDLCKPYSSYGLGKLKDEEIISSSFKDFIILRLCPVIEGDDTDLLKRVYLPKTKIKYRSSYNRTYSFLSHKTIFESIYSILNQEKITNKIINLKDPSNYSESDILKKYDGREVKIPLLITTPLFYFLNLISFLPKIYIINCLLTKMLKSNTYE